MISENVKNLFIPKNSLLSFSKKARSVSWLIKDFRSYLSGLSGTLSGYVAEVVLLLTLFSTFFVLILILSRSNI